MNSFDQQWRTADALSRAGLTVDDVWVRYFSMGGEADAVAVAAYLHGQLMLSPLQRDLLTYAVEELRQSSRSSTGHNDEANHPHHRNPRDNRDRRHGSSAAGTYDLRTWPVLQVRVTDMFDPEEAERHRLVSLQRTGLVAAGRDGRFDQFTRMARNIFNVNSSIISLVTGTEQIIKSVTGPLGGDLAREASFCTHTVAQDQTLVVPDATKDDRFRTNALVTGPSALRFYAGHPLFGPGGWRIGALCLLDVTPRVFTEQDQHALEDIANLAQAEIYAR
jgi:GAF domain-containing protein